MTKSYQLGFLYSVPIFLPPVLSAIVLEYLEYLEPKPSKLLSIVKSSLFPDYNPGILSCGKLLLYPIGWSDNEKCIYANNFCFIGWGKKTQHVKIPYDDLDLYELRFYNDSIRRTLPF